MPSQSSININKISFYVKNKELLTDCCYEKICIYLVSHIFIVNFVLYRYRSLFVLFRYVYTTFKLIQICYAIHGRRGPHPAP